VNDAKDTIITLYVDDSIIAAATKEAVTAIKRCLAKMFKVKEIGGLDKFLGCQLKHKDNKITVVQASYIEKILHENGMLHYNPAKTPMTAAYIRNRDEHANPVESKNFSIIPVS
jgi:hypothetical protein